MAKFQYSLQSILEIKTKLETRAKQEFAKAQGLLAEEEQKLKELEKRRQMYEEKTRSLLQGVLNVREIEENKTASLVVEGCIAEQTVRVEHAREQVERAREEMTRAMRERKTHETLRDQEFEEFLQEENKSEGKAVDELVSYTYGQKGR